MVKITESSKIFEIPTRSTRSKGFFIYLICLVFFIGCASIPKENQSKDFRIHYREYQGYVRAGKTAINKKQYSKAIDNYSKAIELSPFEANHYHYRGLAWYKSGNREKALEDFNKSINLDARSSATYVYRGICRMEGGKYREALSDYKRALNLNPKDASIHNNLAYLYATAQDEQLRNRQKALKYARKAAELTKEKNAQVLDTLARAYFINGRTSEAVKTGKKAMKLDPKNAEYRESVKEYEKALINSKGQAVKRE